VVRIVNSATFIIINNFVTPFIEPAYHLVDLDQAFRTKVDEAR